MCSNNVNQNDVSCREDHSEECPILYQSSSPGTPEEFEEYFDCYVSELESNGHIIHLGGMERRKNSNKFSDCRFVDARIKNFRTFGISETPVISENYQTAKLGNKIVLNVPLTIQSINCGSGISFEGSGCSPLYSHRPQITNIAPNVKQAKRTRTTFTRLQLDSMKQAFKKNQCPSRPERIKIAEDLELNEKQVHIWFRNHRMKYRKEQKEKSLVSFCNIFTPDSNEIINITKHDISTDDLVLSQKKCLMQNYYQNILKINYSNQCLVKSSPQLSNGGTCYYNMNCLPV